MLIPRTDCTGPAEYDVAGVTFLGPEDQEALPYRIAAHLPWNHFGRKNIGYLYAIDHGAKVCGERWLIHFSPKPYPFQHSLRRRRRVAGLDPLIPGLG